MEEDFDRIQRDLNEILVDLQRAARKRLYQAVDNALNPDTIAGLFGQMSHPSGDPYMVLGLERLANDAEVKKRYRELIFILHPDKSGTSGTGLFFGMVQAAYRMIGKERGWT